MSNEHFHLLQDTLRDSHNERGINLSNPQGVHVQGKDYPALNKHLNIDADGSSQATFAIPFENGHRLEVDSWGERDRGYLTNDTHIMSSQLKVPTIRLHGDGTKTYRHGPALHIGVDSFYNRHDSNSEYEPAVNIHDVISTYSKIPHQGTYDWEATKEGGNAFLKVRPNATWGLFGVDGEHLELNPEELHEHHSNFKDKPHHGPSYISVSFHDESGTATHHRYNVKTEQLLPISKKELPNYHSYYDSQS